MSAREIIINDLKKLDKEKIIIAIDGPSASGKTTLAEALRISLDATVFHIDDFFVPLEVKKTNPLYREIGNNYDFLRFEKEIVVPLKENRPVTFRRFCCKTQTLLEAEKVNTKRFVIIEGVYSTHPRFSDLFDLCYFIEIDKETQKERITKRNGSSADRFFNEWIPLEAAYFEKFDVRKSCCLL